jgi:hypothetical protein
MQNLVDRKPLPDIATLVYEFHPPSLATPQQAAFKAPDPRKPNQRRCPAGEPWVKVEANFDRKENLLVRTWRCKCGHSTETRSGCPHTQHGVNSAGRDICTICGDVMVGFAMTNATPGSGAAVPIASAPDRLLIPYGE